MKIDEIDLNILELLEENGRTPNNEIAAKLSISEGTVRNRLKKLLDSKFLVVKGMTNPNLRSDKGLVFLLIRVQPTKKLDEAARRISEIPGVKSVCLLTGRFDLLVEAFIEPPALVQLVGGKLSEIESISSVESLISMRGYNKWV